MPMRGAAKPCGTACSPSLPPRHSNLSGPSATDAWRMQRRNILRGIGLLALAPILTARGNQDPGPWRDAVAYARWAPSPHNIQPWRLHQISPTAAELYCDPSCFLPVTDPSSAFTLMGLAMFVEYLAVALRPRGYALRAEFLQRSLDYAAIRPVLVAHLTLTNGAAEVDYDRQLILERKTSRLPYDGTPVSEADLGFIAAMSRSGGHQFGWSSDEAMVRWVLELNRDTAFMDLDSDSNRNEIRHWIRCTDAEAELTRTGLWSKCLQFPGWLLKDFFDRHERWGVGMEAANVRTHAGKQHARHPHGGLVAGTIRYACRLAAVWNTVRAQLAGTDSPRPEPASLRIGDYQSTGACIVARKTGTGERPGSAVAAGARGSQQSGAAQLPARVARNLHRRARSGSRPVIAFLMRMGLLALSPVHRLLHVSGLCATVLALPGFEGPRWQLGKLGVWIRFFSTLRRVPAYREFIAAQLSTAPLALRNLVEIPSMDKGNYVNAYSLASRCSGGNLPASGLLIDESSGTTGLPTNWVRGSRERAANGRMLKFAVRRRLGTDPLFFINTFALGPWATGVNLTLTLSRWARIKALGPDLAKVINALKTFGPEHHYVILGYPPFLKQLLDSREIDWATYRVSLIFGGEGMGESMRRYLLQKGADRVFGSYGASDLEINIAAETDFTIALRRLLEVRPELARQFLRHAGAMPMIFQFNPAEFFIESNSEGELLITICRPDYVTPKVRYNIHDVGHVMRFPELRRLLAGAGVDTSEMDPHALDLPVLFHYGRSDLSVAYFGCKIPPSDVQETLFRLPAMATAADSFQLRTFEDQDGDKRLVVDLEVPAGSLGEGAEFWTLPFFDQLAAINQDFRESRRMVAKGKGPRLEFHQVGAGPFARADIRIKRTYISREQCGAGAL